LRKSSLPIQRRPVDIPREYASLTALPKEVRVVLEDLHMVDVIHTALRTFQKINATKGLSEDDKKRLKEAYLHNYVEPEARQLLKQKLDERRQLSEEIRASTRTPR
jgi:hypothetical protein